MCCVIWYGVDQCRFGLTSKDHIHYTMHFKNPSYGIDEKSQVVPFLEQVTYQTNNQYP